MPSLKDIRTRIDSVKTTRQVTSAMKMVSAAKLKRAQDDIYNIRPYADKLNEIICELVNAKGQDLVLDFTDKREEDHILVVMITSNRGLCGAFNSNIAKKVRQIVTEEYSAHFKNRNIDVLSIGRQGQKILKANGVLCVNEKNDIYNELSFSLVEVISNEILNDYVSCKYDKVILVFNEFVNAAVQSVQVQQLLPLELPESDVSISTSFIYEPNEEEILRSLIPKFLKTAFFKTILDSVASEHGARMTSMHKATDNATDLLGDLELSYNKARQTSITNEILEIVGGAEALSK